MLCYAGDWLMDLEITDWLAVIDGGEVLVRAPAYVGWPGRNAFTDEPHRAIPEYELRSSAVLTAERGVRRRRHVAVRGHRRFEVHRVARVAVAQGQGHSLRHAVATDPGP